ncbi:hypothetical protein NOCA150241 [metagenome]|uniref:Uncharacterized protein n=1 Tax=metagenome TaxID=256318 RepID=A0A2P2CJ35_9ZZZZ
MECARHSGVHPGSQVRWGGLDCEPSVVAE